MPDSASTVHLVMDANTTRFVTAVSKAAQNFDKSSQRIERSAKRTQSQVQTSFNRMRSAVLALGGALGVAQVKEYADTWQTAENLLKTVVDTTEDLTRVQERVVQTALDTRTSFEGTAQLYSRLARSSRDLGTSEEELFAITETVNKSIALSGATAQEARNGIIQFAQGIASSRLAGDELRAVLEQLPRLAIAIADGMGEDIGRLRELGKQGRLTTEVILEALRSQIPQIAREYESFIPTIEQTFIQLETTLIRTVGEPLSKVLQPAFKVFAEQLVNFVEAVATASNVWKIFATVGLLSLNAVSAGLKLLTLNIVGVSAALNLLESLWLRLQGIDPFESPAETAARYLRRIHTVRTEVDRLAEIKRIAFLEGAAPEVRTVSERLTETRSQAESFVDDLRAADRGIAGFFRGAGQALQEFADSADSVTERAAAGLLDLVGLVDIEPPELKVSDSFTGAGEALQKSIDSLDFSGLSETFTQPFEDFQEAAEAFDSGDVSKFFTQPLNDAQEAADELDLSNVNDQTQSATTATQRITDFVFSLLGIAPAAAEAVRATEALDDSLSGLEVQPPELGDAKEAADKYTDDLDRRLEVLRLRPYTFLLDAEDAGAVEKAEDIAGQVQQKVDDVSPATIEITAEVSSRAVAEVEDRLGVLRLRKYPQLLEFEDASAVEEASRAADRVQRAVDSGGDVKVGVTLGDTQGPVDDLDRRLDVLRGKKYPLLVDVQGDDAAAKARAVVGQVEQVIGDASPVAIEITAEGTPAIAPAIEQAVEAGQRARITLPAPDPQPVIQAAETAAAGAGAAIEQGQPPALSIGIEPLDIGPLLEGIGLVRSEVEQTTELKIAPEVETPDFSPIYFGAEQSVEKMQETFKGAGSRVDNELAAVGARWRDTFSAVLTAIRAGWRQVVEDSADVPVGFRSANQALASIDDDLKFAGFRVTELGRRSKELEEQYRLLRGVLGEAFDNERVKSLVIELAELRDVQVEMAQDPEQFGFARIQGVQDRIKAIRAELEKLVGVEFITPQATRVKELLDTLVTQGEIIRGAFTDILDFRGPEQEVRRLIEQMQALRKLLIALPEGTPAEIIPSETVLRENLARVQDYTRQAKAAQFRVTQELQDIAVSGKLEETERLKEAQKAQVEALLQIERLRQEAEARRKGITPEFKEDAERLKIAQKLYQQHYEQLDRLREQFIEKGAAGIGASKVFIDAQIAAETAAIVAGYERRLEIQREQEVAIAESLALSKAEAAAALNQLAAQLAEEEVRVAHEARVAALQAVQEEELSEQQLQSLEELRDKELYDRRIALLEDFLSRRNQLERSSTFQSTAFNVLAAKLQGTAWEKTYKNITGALTEYGRVNEKVGRAVFLYNQALAAADVVLKTIESVQSGYAWGMAHGGPAVATAVAAAAAAFGAAQLAAIAGTAIGAGSTGAGGGGTASIPATEQIEPEEEAFERQSAVQVIFQGPVLASSDEAREFVQDIIRDAINERDVVIIDANSRQGQIIREGI